MSTGPSVYVANATKETWRLEKRTELQEEEKRLQRHVDKTILLQNILLSENIQIEIVKLCAAIVATASSYELVPLSVRKIFRSRISGINATITIPEHIEVEAMETVKAGGDLRPGQYHPSAVNDYMEKIKNSGSQLSSDNRRTKNNISKFLEMSLQSIAHDLPSDTASKALDTAISAIVDAKVDLVNQSGNSIRAYALSSYLTISEAKPENVRIDWFEKSMVETLRFVDEPYIQEAYKLSQEEHLRIVKQRLNPPELTWDQWFKKLGKQAACAMRHAL